MALDPIKEPLGVALARQPSQDTPKQEDSMSQFVMSRREFAGVVVSVVTATTPFVEPDQQRRVVALGWISRYGGQVTISGNLADQDAAPAKAGR